MDLRRRSPPCDVAGRCARGLAGARPPPAPQRTATPTLPPFAVDAVGGGGTSRFPPCRSCHRGGRGPVRTWLIGTGAPLPIPIPPPPPPPSSLSLLPLAACELAVVIPCRVSCPPCCPVLPSPLPLPLESRTARSSCEFRAESPGTRSNRSRHLPAKSSCGGGCVCTHLTSFLWHLLAPQSAAPRRAPRPAPRAGAVITAQSLSDVP